MGTCRLEKHSNDSRSDDREESIECSIVVIERDKGKFFVTKGLNRETMQTREGDPFAFGKNL